MLGGGGMIVHKQLCNIVNIVKSKKLDLIQMKMNYLNEIAELNIF